jgi:hypothetical protein
MYLVELRPGKEELYRSTDELALAIRNGDVDARSRIYHRATAKWISITLHPQYKAIISAPKEEPAAVRPVRKGWTFLGGISPMSQASTEGPVANGNLLQEWRRPRALGLAGLLLISGMKLAFSGPRPPWSGKGHTVASVPATRSQIQPARQEATENPDRLISLASTTPVWNAEPKTAPEAVDVMEPSVRPALVLPRAPVLRAKALRTALAPSAGTPAKRNSVEAILGRYSSAYDGALTRLQGGIRVARLNRLFAASLLNPNGGVTDTRMSLAGVANFIRVYRQQEAVIEAAYQDTVTMYAKQYGWTPKQVRQWYSRPIRREDPALEVVSGSLVATIDSILGVLDAQAGAYKIRGSAIAFEDPTAGKIYGALRRQIKEQIDSAVNAGGATSPGPTGLLLQAIGTSSLPLET